MASLLASDAVQLIEMFDEMIDKSSDAANTLACMRLVVARMGMIADVLARENGGDQWSEGTVPYEWLWQSPDVAQAWHLLNQSQRA